MAEDKPSKIGFSTDAVERLIKEIHSREIDSTEGEEADVSVKADPSARQDVSRLTRLLQQVIKQVDSSQVFQTFKLPGTQTVVHDRRGEQAPPTLEQKMARESKMPLEELLVRQGKLSPTAEKTYENYLADPAKRMKPAEQKAAEDRLQKMLTRFEEILLKRFEEDQAVEKKTQEGEQNFLRKTVDQWKNFFDHFRHRTVRRELPMEALREMVFRDLVQNQGRKTLISDLVFSNGRLEKFARLRLQEVSSALLTRLTELSPGTQWTAAQAAEMLKNEELYYLAIRQAEAAQRAFAEAPTRGLFGSAKTEEQVSRELGIPLSMLLRQKTKVVREQTRRRSRREEDLEEGGPGETFVPMPGPTERKPFPFRSTLRWFVPVAYVAATAVLAIVIWWLFRSL